MLLKKNDCEVQEKHCVKISTRDYNLDFYKGLASISIVFIHTAFYSGESYIPSIMRMICLLVDVPLFIFLSGWGASYNKDFKKMFYGLINTWIKWILFVTLLDFSSWAFYGKTIQSPYEYISQIVFGPLSLEHFVTVRGSMWYMPMYFLVATVGGVLVALFRNFQKLSTLTNEIIIFLLVGLFYISATGQDSWFLLSRMCLFYLPIYLLGYKASSVSVLTTKVYVIAVLISLGSWWGLSYALQIDPYNLQAVNFPPHIIYFAASMLSILSCIYFRRYTRKSMAEKCKFIRFLGKNSLCFYFSQGIGGSFIYRFTNLADSFGWLITMVLLFIINLTVTVICGCLLVLFYKVYDRIAMAMISFIKQFLTTSDRA